MPRAFVFCMADKPPRKSSTLHSPQQVPSPIASGQSSQVRSSGYTRQRVLFYNNCSDLTLMQRPPLYVVRCCLHVVGVLRKHFAVRIFGRHARRTGGQATDAPTISTASELHKQQQYIYGCLSRPSKQWLWARGWIERDRRHLRFCIRGYAPVLQFWQRVEPRIAGKDGLLQGRTFPMP
jgi:hypothetical protein